MAGDAGAHYRQRSICALPRTGKRGEIDRSRTDFMCNMRRRILQKCAGLRDRRRRFRRGGIVISHPVRFKVYLIHRRDKMRASVIMQERVFANKKIEPIWNTVVTQYIPDEKGEMRAVRLRNIKTNEGRELEVACVFMAIGHDPNTKPYGGKLDKDADGYLITKNLVESKYPGVFVAGDVAEWVY